MCGCTTSLPGELRGGGGGLPASVYSRTGSPGVTSSAKIAGLELSSRGVIQFAVDNNPNAVYKNAIRAGLPVGSLLSPDLVKFLNDMYISGMDISSIINVPYIDRASNYTGGLLQRYRAISTPGAMPKNTILVYDPSTGGVNARDQYDTFIGPVTPQNPSPSGTTSYNSPNSGNGFGTTYVGNLLSSILGGVSQGLGTAVFLNQQGANGYGYTNSGEWYKSPFVWIALFVLIVIIYMVSKRSKTKAA